MSGLLNLNISCKMEKHEQGEMRAACSKVPKLSSITIGTLHYPENKTTGLLCETNITNLRIVGCSHTVGWNLI